MFCDSERRFGNRGKEEKIAEQVSAELVQIFITALERGDIEALSLPMRKISKTAGEFAEGCRWEAAEAAGMAAFRTNTGLKPGANERRRPGADAMGGSAT